MIPNIKACLSPYDNRTVDLTIGVNIHVPHGIMVWLKRKVEKRFCGEAMVPGILGCINGYIDSQLNHLVNTGYIFKNNKKWVIHKSLFVWVKE